MESNNTSSIGKLALFFLALFIFAVLLAYHASAATIADNVYYFSHDDANVSGTIEGNWFSPAHNGTHTNTASDTGIIDEGRDYDDGTTDMMLVNNYAAANLSTNDYTICAWIRVEAYTANRYILSNRASQVGNNDGMWIIQIQSDGGGLLFRQHSGTCAAGCAQTIEVDTAESGYKYYCWMKDGNNNTVYVDGALNKTENDGISGCDVSCYSSDIVHGTFWFSGTWQGGSFGGDLDEVSIWNTTLTADEISALYNSGSGCNPYITDCFGTGPAPTTDIDFTAVDDYTGSSINNFGINVSWGNGTTSFYSTTNGTVSLVNISDSNLTINVTYNVSGYFNQTLYNEAITVNTSNSVQASMYQAVASLAGYEKITNNLLSGVTFYIGSKSGTEFNLTAGTHNVTAVKAGYYNLSTQITVPSLSNASYNITGLYSTIVNFTAYNAISNATVSSFTIDLDFGESVSTTNGTVYINMINNTNYTFNISSPGAFTSRYNLNFTPNASIFNVNTSLYTFNSIRFNIFNESSMTALTQAVTVHTISNLTTFSNTTSTGFIIIDLLQPNEYEIRFESTGFNPRSLFLTVTNDSTQNVTVYMTENVSTELQRIEVLDSANQPVEGAVVWLQKEHINESDRWITIQEAQTDYNGETSVFVERDVTIFYRFAVIYEGEARPIQPTGNLFTGPTSFIPGVEETIQLIIDLEEDPEDFISDDLAIAVSCNMSNTTAVCTIIDGRNSITGAELRLEAAYINKSLAWESIMNDSFTGSSGSLQVNLTTVNNSIWRARAYVLFEDSESLVWEDEYRFDIDVIVEKNTGLLYAVIILAVVFGLTVMWGPLPSGLVGFAALIPLTAIKIISIPIGVITGLLALVVIFFFRTRKTSTE